LFESKRQSFVNIHHSTPDTHKFLAANNGTQVTYYQTNVLDGMQIDTMFVDVIASLRYPLRGVVAGSGVGGSSVAIYCQKTKWRRTVDINLAGTFLVAQRGAREMTRHRLSESMVLVSSMAGYVSLRGGHLADYESSKPAVFCCLSWVYQDCDTQPGDRERPGIGKNMGRFEHDKSDVLS